uniref:Vitellogenin n=2 Tax=Harmonia axyridis TaxID=115357 RepID=A0A808MDG5_HARAX|nr:vitellogenin [Harmonia axyridis]
MVGFNMRSQFLICFFVGLALAHPNNPAWKSNTEYTYEVSGRTLASFNGISDEYTGIVLRAKLLVHPQGTDRLRCQINHPEYAEVHTTLTEGWMSKLPENKLSYRPLKMANKPFEVVLKNGVVKDVIVEKEVSQWEANVIKSFVSQFQLDTKAENAIHSDYNVLPNDETNNAVYKTIEDTVTGITETSYDIHPMPEYILQAEPHLAPFPHLKGDGSIIEIVKNKNYTAGHQLPAYFVGLGKAGKWQIAGNRMGGVIHRNSFSRAIVTGTLQRYTIQYSETTNEIVVSLKTNRKGSVNSMIRIKLVNAQQQTSQLSTLSSPVRTGSLVYTYQKEKSEGFVSEGRTFESHKYMKHSDDEVSYTKHHKRHPRSLFSSEETDEGSMESEEEWTSLKPKLSEYFHVPLVGVSIGYNGLSIKKAPGMQIVEKACSFAQKIASDLEEPEEIPKKQTLGKFITLTAILRVMDEQELKQAAQRLYTKETKGHKYNTWVIFRDSVAECGTGPAFMVIKHYIETKKLEGYEAAGVISTMGGSVRQPTEEYMRSFYGLVKSQIEDQQDTSSLNETVLFTFSELAHNVYVDRNFSHREYPTHAFGKFYTTAGRTFIKEEVIPYITKQMKEAISNGDSRKINTYIRALGQIGDRQILYAFEPYLEGKIPCSQFQRLLMVLSLRDVARVHPEAVGPILYRIYQNIGETTELRVASVYILMHTSPSAEMLQRIAKYTQIETDHRVSAAVKSAIKSVASLEGSQFAPLRSAAESASHYLTEKDYGIQDSQDLFKSYAYHNWGSYYKHVLQTIVSEQSGIPSSFYASFQGDGQGMKYKSFTFESVFSDIRNLAQVFQKKTRWYKEEQNKHQSSQQSEQSTWSSPNIARMLNLQTEELEQLEGIIALHLGELKKHFIFDNHTIESLPETIEQILSNYENGKKIEYTKLFNNRNGVIAYPTVTGLPFFIKYEVPVLVHIEGSVKAKSQPRFASNGEFILPEKIELGGELKIAVSAKQQLKYGFVAPFSHHEYYAGRDDDVQVYLPVKSEIVVDIKKNKFHFEIEPLETERKIKIFQVTSAPYTSKQDILELDATAEKKNVHIIRKSNPQQWEQVIGDRSIGMAFRVKYENDDRYYSIKDLVKDFYELDALYKKVDVEYVPELSRNKKLSTDVIYRQETKKECNEQDGKAMIAKLSELPRRQDERVAEITKYASAGIQNARMQVLDASVHFSGEQSVDYIMTMTYARNQEDSKSRLLAYVKKHCTQSRPFAAAVSMKFDMARVTGLDVDYIMNTNLQSSVTIDGAFSETLPTKNQFQIEAKLKRSSARKQYLMEQPYYHRCQSESQQGNKQLLACANITQMAGLLDSMSIKMKYSKMSSKDVYSVLSAYNSFVPQDSVFGIEYKQHKNKQGEIDLEVQFSPELERANISLYSRDVQAYIKDKAVDSWARHVFVSHPVFNVVDRVAGKLYGLKTFKPICTMDKSAAYTFDGYEYPLTLSNYWTVLMQYVPLRSSDDSYSTVEEQLKHELYNYVVLAKQSSQGSHQKDVKIVVSTPATEGKVVEITMKPMSSGEYPQVYVNDKQVSVKRDGDSETYYNQVTILGLPNSEVYVRVHDDFYVIYDGKRVKITSLGVKLRNRVRGLCGTFDSLSYDDFTTPSNCVVRDAKELIASYTVLKNGESSPEVTEYKNSHKSKCIHKKLPLYVNYISKKEESMYSSQSPSRSQQSSSSCMNYQTRYVVENVQMCFTVRPLKVCSPGCQEESTVYQSVDVHCVENKNVASLWKSQIDKGASPDFSHKSVTKSAQIQVPISCRSY